MEEKTAAGIGYGEKIEICDFSEARRGFGPKVFHNIHLHPTLSRLMKNLVDAWQLREKDIRSTSSSILLSNFI